jgi:hypothetical protein
MSFERQSLARDILVQLLGLHVCDVRAARFFERADMDARWR